MSRQVSQPNDGPTLEEQAELLERLTLNAPTLEAAKRYHEALDKVRAQLPPEARGERDKGETSDYRRGYQAGHQAARTARR